MTGHVATRGGAIRHAVQFYGDDRELIDGVTAHLRHAIDDGGSAVVIATPTHVRAFEVALAAGGIDTSAARRDGTFTSVDAEATLATFMVDGHPVADAFDTVVGGLLAGADAGDTVAFGEMVALLWESGEVVAAMELEGLWNDLLERRRFSLVCGYASSIVGGPAGAALRALSDVHSEVLDPPARPVQGRLARLAFPREDGSPRAARLATTDLLQRWGYATAVGDAGLVVSELATNAVIHARSDFAVTLSCEEGTVRIGVEDRDPRSPIKRDLSSGSVGASGNGLVIVDAVADRWWTALVGDGRKVVWAEVSRDDVDQGR